MRARVVRQGCQRAVGERVRRVESSVGRTAHRSPPGGGGEGQGFGDDVAGVAALGGGQRDGGTLGTQGLIECREVAVVGVAIDQWPGAPEAIAEGV